MSESARITKAAGVVGAATLASRILGLVRDVVVASAFGAGMVSDVFFVAFRIPNLLRRLFAEGSLTISFIPVFTDELRNRGKEEAFKLGRSAWWILSLVLFVVTLLGILFASTIVVALAPGFSASAEKFQLAVDLTQIVFPYVFFISLVALAMGILNTMGHFAAPALAPVMLNVSLIGSVWFVCPLFDQPALGLALGVIVGGLLQLGLQFPFLRQVGFRLFVRGPLYHKAIKRIGVLMVPAVFGAAVYQINILVGTILASLLPEGSVSHLYYADRLVQFPLGVFALALATAVLPALSRQAADGDMEGLKDSFSYAFKLVFFITIPASVGLVVLRAPIVELCFQRGAFDGDATRLTAEALLYYSVGLWAISGVRILVAAFHALQDTRTPMRMAVVSLGANIVLSLALMGPMAHGGLAFATSLASAVNLVLLTWALKKRLGRIGGRDILRSLIKSCICSTFMGVAVFGFMYCLTPRLGSDLLGLVTIGLGGVVLGLGVYGLCARGLGCTELAAVADMVRVTIRKKRQ